MQNFYFPESQEKATRYHSQLELLKIDEERQKVETEQKLQHAKKDLSSTVAELEARQAELIEKLKVKCHHHVKYGQLFFSFLFCQGKPATLSITFRQHKSGKEY